MLLALRTELAQPSLTVECCVPVKQNPMDGKFLLNADIQLQGVIAILHILSCFDSVTVHPAILHCITITLQPELLLIIRWKKV